MSDIRKPYFIMMLKNQGKKKYKKIELFNAKLWKIGVFISSRKKTDRYRIRVNGKWFNDKSGNIIFYTKTQFRDLLMRSIDI